MYFCQCYPSDNPAETLISKDVFFTNNSGAFLTIYWASLNCPRQPGLKSPFCARALLKPGQFSSYSFPSGEGYLLIEKLGNQYYLIPVKAPNSYFYEVVKKYPTTVPGFEVGDVIRDIEKGIGEFESF